jgi:hypothetical protein
MARKKRAWNMTNPLYRYLHKGKKTNRKRKGGYVARKKHGFKRGSGGSKVFGLSSKGLLGSFGILGVAGAALFSDQLAALIPVNLPFKQHIAAFAIAGPAGVGAKVVKDMVMPSGGSSGGVILY